MRISPKKLAFISLFTIPLILTYKSCKYFWNPHYLDNKSVFIKNKLFSPDSTFAVIYYTLYAGVAGPRSYKSISKPNENYVYPNLLPEQIIVLGWHDEKTLFVKYDPNEPIRLGGGSTDLDLTRDTLKLNGVTVVIKERVQKILNYIP